MNHDSNQNLDSIHSHSIHSDPKTQGQVPAGSTKPDGVVNGEEPLSTLPWFNVQAGVTAPSAFASRAWQVQRGSLPSSRFVPQHRFAGWWGTLPIPNQFVIGFWMLWIGWITFKFMVPLMTGALQSVIFPYTGEGRRQTCLNNLRAIYQATSLYADDSEGQFPPLDMPGSPKGSAGGRTWVSAIQGRVPEDAFQCPRAPAIPRSQPLVSSSYVMNPVLGGSSPKAMDNPIQTLLLADGGERHDVSLLPPYPSWPSGREQIRSSGDASNSTGSSQPALDLGALNFAFRHQLESGSPAVAVLYADGHADSPSEAGLQEQARGRSLWGGSALMRLALARLGVGSPLRSVFVDHLKTGDVAGAASDLRSHRQALSPLCHDLLALWQLNDPTAGNGGAENDASGSDASEMVDRVGWNLALAQKQAGQSSVEVQLNREMARRSDVALQAATGAGEQDRDSELGWTIQVPGNWTREEKEMGRYRQTVFHSALKDVSLVVEVGRNATYHTPCPVDWSGMEGELRSKAGSGYRRINRGPGFLAGWPAGIWDYEVDKAGSPRLRKLTIGHSGEASSYILVCTAPAAQFQQWRPVFERAIGSYQWS